MGKRRELETSDLVITVADKPVALQVSWVEKLQKSLKSLLVWFLKRLSSMANRSVRQSGRLNLRSESSSRFEKGINVATVNEAHDAAASMIADWLVQPYVRASFQQASWILQMWKFLPLLQM